MALLDLPAVHLGTRPSGATRPTPEPGLRTLPQVRTAALGGAAFVVVTAAHVAHLAPVDGLVVVAVLVLTATVVVPVRHVLLLTVTGWALVTGFLVNAGGQLTDHGSDLERLAALGAVALVALVVRGVVRH